MSPATTVLTIEDLRAATGERYLDMSPAMIRSLFGSEARPEEVELFRQAFWQGSRAGLVNIFVRAWESHWWRDMEWVRKPHAVMAHLAAEVWIEGKAHSALAEFGLEETHDIYPDDLLTVMSPFRCSMVIMEADDLAAFAALPETFAVWRGGAGDPDHVRLGHSWTTDRSVAERFADRASRTLSAPPVVLRRRIPKNSLVAYFSSREEAEAVLWPSRYAIDRKYLRQRQGRRSGTIPL